MRAWPGADTYTRPITPSDWVMLAQPRGLSSVVQLCVEGEGAIDPAALAAAVAAASQACPGARLVRRGGILMDSGVAPAVRVAEAADFDRERLDSPLLRAPLGRRRKASCEVVLVRGTPATVIFRAHHAVMDGHGAMFWQRQVFRALRGEPVESARSRLTEVMEAIAANLGVDLPPRLALPGLDGTAGEPLLGTVPSGPRQCIWRRRIIDGVHPTATARIAWQAAALGNGNGVIDVPVDLRQFLPGLKTTAMVSGKVKVRVRPDEDFDDVHASLLAALQTHQYLAIRGAPGTRRVPMPVLRAILRRGDDKIRKSGELIQRMFPLASVSHLGGVDLAELCADGFEATSFYSLGSVSVVPEINIVECGGRTEVTVAGRDGPGVGERAEALLDAVEEELSPRRHRSWDGNQTSRPAPPATLTSLFAEQVRATPHAVAISGPDGDITYAELSRRADAIAACLQARGARPGDRVGLLAGRTADAITAIWGILRAGAAYLPIDDTYPDARVTAILTGASAPLCLLQPPNDQRTCLPPGCTPVSLTDIPPSPPPAWHPPATRPGDLACVIYTSGSTGTPKGVEIEHRGLVNFTRWVTREARIDAATKMPLIASISFDLTGFAVYLPLLAGGTVIPVPDVNAVTLREVIEDSGINGMAITPSHLDLINRAGIRRATMRFVMCAGEMLRRSTALRALETFGPGCRILNQWGPTETTIVNTSHEFDPEADTDAGVPLGRPMDNNTVHLLDPHGRHVPPGEPGEAYIGGTQLARGYLGRPDLTRQRFTRLADGTRAYRTGDILRLLPSGDLTFISRADDQVKINGHRIEPAEIAQALENHPHVTQAVVIPRTRPGRTSKELCAYVTGNPPPHPDQLRTYLTTHLPSYMIPATITPLHHIPRNTNGKTDTTQLPNPFTTPTPTPDSPHDLTSDADDLTAAIAAIWTRALNVSAAQIAEDANFHQLGGNSLILLTVVDEVARAIPGPGQEQFMSRLRDIIREPTLRRISDLARQARDQNLALQSNP